MPDNMSGNALFREKVERVVNERIRPLLRMHEGDMAVRDARDGEIWIALSGACKTCPSAQITMEEIIGQTLKEELGNEYAGVHLVNETDEELLNFARALLNKNRP